MSVCSSAQEALQLRAAMIHAFGVMVVKIKQYQKDDLTVTKNLA
jgi:hypothetical protein